MPEHTKIANMQPWYIVNEYQYLCDTTIKLLQNVTQGQ
jgi:hypothetical protein